MPPMLPLTLAVGWALPWFALMAQETKTVQEPEYLNVVLYLDPATGALTPLERQKPQVASKVKALGFGGFSVSMIYDGPRSPTRFKAGQEIRFVMRANPHIEPDSLVNLDLLAVSKQQRGRVTMKASGMSASVKSQTGDTMRPLRFSKYGPNSIEFTPAKPLEPGEYAITATRGSTAFLFGIDPK